MSSASESSNGGGPIDLGDFAPPAAPPGPSITPETFTNGSVPTLLQGGNTFVSGNGSVGPYFIAFPHPFPTNTDSVVCVQGTALSFINTWVSIDSVNLNGFFVIFGSSIGVGQTPQIWWQAFGH